MAENWSCRIVAATSRLLGLVMSSHSLALFDQLIASGTNFLATLMIARFAGASSLGVYVISVTVTAAVIGCQDALIIKPYTIQRFRLPGSDAENAGMALSLSIILGMICAAGLLIAGAVLYLADAGLTVTIQTVILACALPAILAREFARRFAFTHLNMPQAIAIDGAVAVQQVLGLGLVGYSGHLGAGTALCSIGLASASTALGWRFLLGKQLNMWRGSWRAETKRSWSLGKWLLAGQLTREIQQSIPYWVLSLIIGSAATGVYAACTSVVSFANPVIFGLGNIITTRSVLAWRTSGGPGLWRQALRDTALLSSFMAAFCIVIFFEGDRIISWLYPRGGFEMGTGLTFLLALSMLAMAGGIPPSNALAAMERPRAIFGVGVAGAAVSITLVFAFLLKWGLIGAAAGFLAGNVLTLGGRWIALYLLIPRAAALGPALAAATQFWSNLIGPASTAERLGEGDFATTYLVKSARPDPELPASVVVKVYKKEPATSEAEGQAQFDALSALYQNLNGEQNNGWSARVPHPLRLIDQPYALIMGYVPGRPLAEELKANDEPANEIVTSAARSVALLMSTCWSASQIHGDFGLRNMLFDTQLGTISFIDPGTMASCSTCCRPSTRVNPAATDLGHHLFDLVTDVSDIVGGPRNREKRQLFALTLVEKVLQNCSASQRLDLLGAINDGVSCHLTAKLSPSVSPRGIWHLFISWIAIRRLRSLIAYFETYIEILASH